MSCLRTSTFFKNIFLIIWLFFFCKPYSQLLKFTPEFPKTIEILKHYKPYKIWRLSKRNYESQCCDNWKDMERDWGSRDKILDILLSWHGRVPAHKLMHAAGDRTILISIIDYASCPRPMMMIIMIAYIFLGSICVWIYVYYMYYPISNNKVPMFLEAVTLE